MVRMKKKLFEIKRGKGEWRNGAVMREGYEWRGEEMMKTWGERGSKKR